MPRDASGNYTLPPSNPVVDGTIIESEWANSTMTDIALQLNNVLTRDGVVGPTQPMKFPDGTVANPSITFLADAHVGLFRPTVNAIGFTANGIEVARFDNTQIRFAKPVNLAIPGANAYYNVGAPAGFIAGISMAGNGTISGTTSFDIYSSTDGAAVFNQHDSKNIYTFIGGVERMRIETSGNTVFSAAADITQSILAPTGFSASIHLNGDGAVSGTNSLLIAQIPGGDVYFRNERGASNIRFQIGLIESFTISETQVHAGVAFSGTGTAGVWAESTQNFGMQEDANSRWLRFEGPTGGAVSISRSSGTMWIWPRGSPKPITLPAGTGNIQAVEFQVHDTNGEFRMFGLNPRVLMFQAGWQWNWDATNGDLLWVSASASHMTLRSAAKDLVLWSGPAYKPGGGPWSDTSDVRVKQNVRPYTQGLAAINQLNPCVYNFIPEVGRNSDQEYIGLVAQEVQPIMPEMISLAPAPVEGVGLPDDLLVMDPNALTYALINAVKELNARVVALEGV